MEFDGPTYCYLGQRAVLSLVCFVNAEPTPSLLACIWSTKMSVLRKCLISMLTVNHDSDELTATVNASTGTFTFMNVLPVGYVFVNSRVYN